MNDNDLNDGDPRGLFASYLDAAGLRREQPFTAFRAGETVLRGDGMLFPADPAHPAAPAYLDLGAELHATVGLPPGRHPVWLRVEPNAQGDPQVVLAVVPFGHGTPVRWATNARTACPIRSGLLCLGPVEADPRTRLRLLALARPEIHRRGLPEPGVGALFDKALAAAPDTAAAPGAFRKGWQVLPDPATGADLVGVLTRARVGRQAIGRATDGSIASYVLDLTAGSDARG
ncbi:hypothetical protein ACEZDE_27390 [Streptacidiphilus sp. N8-3]|uniref:FAD-binding FR-type domain-containing protein n=1 Tax=Streptacidiphilus cavernicola TaxID=3342716 RepID=A0ABV6W2W7_9ACTN